MSLRVVVPFALICGLLAAFAASTRASHPHRAATLPAAAPAIVTAPRLPRLPVLGAACPPKRQAQPAKPPSQTLLDALGVLRRARTPEDALSKKASDALRQRGVRVADPNAARLLRTTANGRAWVVPVPDVTVLFGARLVPCSTKFARPVRRRLRSRRAARRALPVTPLPAVVAATPVPFGPALVEPAPLAWDGKPQEGVVVVAEGDTPAGGGATFRQLIRGLGSPEVAPCAGPKHDLVGVSGMVPDGVGSVFLTSPDGTAIKADVEDNAYSFLVPPAKGRAAFAPRYVVWTGGDGTPHVQPVTAGMTPRAGRICARLARVRDAVVRVTPLPTGLYPFTRAVLPAFVTPPRPARARAPTRP